MGSTRLPVHARTLGALLLAWPLLTLCWLVLPHPEEVDEASVGVVLVLVAMLGGALLAGALDRRPTSSLHAVLALSSVLISAQLHFSHAPGTGFASFYLWTTPYAYAFFSIRQAAVQTLITGAGYAAVLALNAGLTAIPSHAMGRWVLTVGTVVAVGMLVRRLTESLRASDLRFRRGFADASTGMALVTPAGAFAQVNGALCRLLGYSESELLARSALDITHADDVELVHTTLERALRTGASQHFDKRCIRRDGGLVWSTIDASVVAGDDGPLLLVQAQDATERKLGEEAQRRQARQQATIAQLGRFALRERDLDALAEQIAARVHETLGADLCSVLALEGEGLTLRAGAGWPDTVEPGLIVPVDATRQVGHTAMTAETVITDDVSAGGGLRFAEAFSAQGARAGMTVAVVSGEEPWGVLAVHSRAPRGFLPDEADFLDAVAHVLSTAVERHSADERIRRQALHDPLTGLPNRALALDRLDAALGRSRSDGARGRGAHARPRSVQGGQRLARARRRRRAAAGARAAPGGGGPAHRHRRPAGRRRVHRRLRGARRSERRDRRGGARSRPRSAGPSGSPAASIT